MTTWPDAPTEADTGGATAGASSDEPAQRGVGAVLADLVALPVTAARFVLEAFRWMIVGPIARDHIRLDRRSAGMRAMAVVAIVLTAVMLALTIAAPAIRSASDLAVSVSVDGTASVPRGIVWVFVLVIAVFVALLQTGALHTAAWFRIATLGTVAAMLVFIGAIDTTGGMSPGLWVAIGASAALVALQVLRWRATPVWWEAPIVLAVTTTVLVVVYARSGDVAGAYGIDRVAPLTDSIIRSFRLISIPLAVFAGVAIAKVALSGMTLVSDFTAERFTPPTLGIIAAGIVGWRLVSTTRGWVDDLRTDAGDTLTALIGTLAVVAVVAFAWWLAHHLLDRADTRARRLTDEHAPVSRSATTVEQIVDRLDDVAIPAAVVMTITTAPAFLALLVRQSAFAIAGGDHWVARAAESVSTFTSQDATIRWTRIIGGLGLVAAGMWLAHRGRRGMAELTAVVGATLAAVYAADSGVLFGDAATRPVLLDRLGVLVAVGVAVVWAVRRSLSTDRLSTVVLLVLVASLFADRDFVSSPLTALLGTSGIALVLFGFVWTFLADAGKTGADSPGFPRDSRLLLFCAQSLFGLAVLAWVALSRDPSTGLDLRASSDLGDATLGVALLAAVYLAVLDGALRTADFADTAVAAEAIALPFDEQLDSAEETIERAVEEAVDQAVDQVLDE